MRHASTVWRRARSCGARFSPTARPTRSGGRGMGRSRDFGACAPSTCSIETFVAPGYLPPAMNVIPQNVGEEFGRLLDAVALLLVRLDVRPNVGSYVDTRVVVASA